MALTFLTSKQESGSLDVDDQGDDEFLSLISEISQVAVDPESAVENCPVCLTGGIKLVEWATHVLECVRAMDERESKQVAERLAQESGPQQLVFQKPEICPLGTRCTRRDAQHFRLLSHPNVSCPVCNDPYSIIELDSHLNACIERGGVPIKGGMDDEGLSAAAPIEDDSVELPPAASSVPLFRSSSNPLTLQQAAAMAQSVLALRQSSSVETTTSPQVNEMLDAFGSLGFTRDTLQQLLEQQRRQ